MVSLLLIAAAASAGQPSPEALRLGEEIARHGTLAALLPLKERQDAAELIAEDKTLSPTEQTQLRTTVARLYADAEKRLFSSTGRAYAERLTLADLRKVVAFYRTGAAQRFQEAVPGAIVATMQSVRQTDLKNDARSAFCKETGKLCGR